MLCDHAPRPVIWPDSEAVHRRVNRTPSTLERLLADADRLPTGTSVPLGTGGTLRLDAPLQSDRGGHLQAWYARGRLVGRGLRLARFSRIDIEIWPWSAESMELRVTPRARHVHRWGTRRQRRSFWLAHAAADNLLRVLGPDAGPGQSALHGADCTNDRTQRR